VFEIINKKRLSINIPCILMMLLYQKIGNDMPNPKIAQANETELAPLKEGKTIENALFDLEYEPQNIRVRIKNIHINLIIRLIV
jgi:hypothetical protein